MKLILARGLYPTLSASLKISLRGWIWPKLGPHAYAATIPRLAPEAFMGTGDHVTYTATIPRLAPGAFMGTSDHVTPR